MSITSPLSRIRSITSARPLGLGARAIPPPAPFLVVSAVVAIYLRPPDLLREDDFLFVDLPFEERLRDDERPLEDERLRDDDDDVDDDDERLRFFFGSPPFELFALRRGF